MHVSPNSGSEFKSVAEDHLSLALEALQPIAPLIKSIDSSSFLLIDPVFLHYNRRLIKTCYRNFVYQLIEHAKAIRSGEDYASNVCLPDKTIVFLIFAFFVIWSGDRIAQPRLTLPNLEQENDIKGIRDKQKNFAENKAHRRQHVTPRSKLIAHNVLLLDKGLHDLLQLLQEASLPYVNVDHDVRQLQYLMNLYQLLWESISSYRHSWLENVGFYEGVTAAFGLSLGSSLSVLPGVSEFTSRYFWQNSRAILTTRCFAFTSVFLANLWMGIGDNLIPRKTAASLVSTDRRLYFNSECEVNLLKSNSWENHIINFLSIMVLIPGASVATWTTQWISELLTPESKYYGGVTLPSGLHGLFLGYCWLATLQSIAQPSLVSVQHLICKTHIFSSPGFVKNIQTKWHYPFLHPKLANNSQAICFAKASLSGFIVLIMCGYIARQGIMGGQENIKFFAMHNYPTSLACLLTLTSCLTNAPYYLYLAMLQAMRFSSWVMLTDNLTMEIIKNLFSSLINTNLLLVKPVISLCQYSRLENTTNKNNTLIAKTITMANQVMRWIKDLFFSWVNPETAKVLDALFNALLLYPDIESWPSIIIFYTMLCAYFLSYCTNSINDVADNLNSHSIDNVTAATLTDLSNASADTDWKTLQLEGVTAEQIQKFSIFEKNKNAETLGQLADQAYTGFIDDTHDLHYFYRPMLQDNDD